MRYAQQTTSNIAPEGAVSANKRSRWPDSSGSISNAAGKGTAVGLLRLRLPAFGGEAPAPDIARRQRRFARHWIRCFRASDKEPEARVVPSFAIQWRAKLNHNHAYLRVRSETRRISPMR